MARREAKFELDEELLRAVDKEAASKGQRPSEVVELAVRSYLRRGSAFERAWEENRNPLNDEEAMALANEEVHALRAERQS
ncbi:MAG: hypothetical protein ACRDLB_01640 [Actinomycetota bacterium]